MVGKIYITGHQVGAVGPTHMAVEFDDGIAGAQWISAGPEGYSAEGFDKLVGGIGNVDNGIRQTDRPDLNVTIGEITPPRGMSIGDYISALKSAAGNYQNDVDYDMFPGVSNGYNSNSYVSGLVNATGGISSANLSSFVGGNKPLPSKHFGN